MQIRCELSARSVWSSYTRVSSSFFHVFGDMFHVLDCPVLSSSCFPSDSVSPITRSLCHSAPVLHDVTANLICTKKRDPSSSASKRLCRCPGVILHISFFPPEGRCRDGSPSHLGIHKEPDCQRAIGQIMDERRIPVYVTVSANV
jgi:hypothetical protein